MSEEPLVPAERKFPRIKLNRISGNRVESEWMVIDDLSPGVWMRVPEICAHLRQEMIRQFKFRPEDVSVVQMHDISIMRTKFQVIAHLTPLGPEHTVVVHFEV